MPEQSVFDLSKPDAWWDLRPGMTRAQVIEAMKRLNLEIEPHDVEHASALVNEEEIEFWFATDGSERLRQLALGGEELRWAGKPLMAASVDDALRAVEPMTSAMWEANDATDEPFPPPGTLPTQPSSDEALLEEGTIWLPERALGLVIYQGKVMAVAWRLPQDLPAQFAGPVTEAQRQLSRRPDLEEYLMEKRMKRIEVATPKDPLRFLRRALTLGLIVALALTGRDGLKEMFLWGNAPTVKAKMAGLERGPMKQFLEYLPAPVTRNLPRWLLAGKWSGTPGQTDLYRMEYTDPHGQRREVRLEAAEFYVPPREIGEEVDLIYVDEEPPRVKGPSRARDAAFLEHVPWAIALGALYLAAQFLISLLPALFRVLRSLAPKLVHLAPKGTVKDPERPELR